MVKYSIYNKMRRILCGLALFSCSFFAQGQSVPVNKTQHPNIIVFLVDDMGWMDTSVPFGDSVMPLNKRYRTPNMERLAREGMKFANAYAAPVCTPTRVSMISGMNVIHHHVTNWTSPHKDDNTDNPDDEFNAAQWNINGLSPVKDIPKTIYATPLPQLLKEAGYFTIHVGKAHWAPAGTPGANPNNMGFVVNIAGHSAGHPQSYLGTQNYGNLPGKASAQAVPDLEEFWGTETFLTEALTQSTLKALDEPIKRRQPFYLYLAHYAVHVPLMADQRYYKKYLDEGLDTLEAKYATMVEGMDKSLGDLMDYLKQKGIEKNTVILFMSDNGGLSLAPPRGGEPHTQNAPLKAGKGSVYEGGIREPMIVKWPGVAQPNTVARQYVIVEDFFPSILEMAGVKNYKTVQAVDGKSFVPVLKNKNYADSARTLIWHFPDKWVPKDGPGINYFSAIRQGSWKLVYSMRRKQSELYNLQNDIGERHNLAEQYPQKVKQLATLLSQQLKAAGAPMPSYKKDGNEVPLPDGK